MAAINLPMAESYQPASFAERGVDAPFTAPMLVGARLRHMARPGLELAVRNPSGGRGVYILPWPSARSLCQPTLHDLRLYDEIRRVPTLSPAVVRSAARIVATEGLAGEAAQQAAIAAAAADAEARNRSAAKLWLGLRAANLPGLTPQVVARHLDAIGALFVPIGLPPDADTARLPLLLAGLHALCDEAGAWARINAGEGLASVAAMVSAAAATVRAVAAPLLRDARARAEDVPALLRCWMRDPEEVAARISRAEWVLDGWDRILLLWRDAGWPAARRAALLEMAQLVPDLPQQAADWAGGRSAPVPSMRDCRVISLSESWRTGGASFGLIARNERFRAQSA